MALIEVSKHALWLIHILSQLDFDVNLPLKIFSNSLGTCAIAANAIFHKWTKHIDIKYHFICERIADGLIAINKIASKDNLTDVLTKLLPWNQHATLSQL